MKALAIVFLILAFAIDSKAQNEVLLHIPATGKSVSDFIPKGYDTLQVAVGDLNKDGKQDLALALFNVSLEGSNEPEVLRWIVIAFKEANGYRMVFKGTNLLLCKTCGGIFGDPFAELLIKNGTIRISHYGGSSWRWSRDQVFRFQNNDFYLIGNTKHSFWSVKQCEALGDEFAGTKFEDINLVTGDRVRKEISEDCELIIDKKDKIKVKSLVKMADTKIIDN